MGDPAVWLARFDALPEKERVAAAADLLKAQRGLESIRARLSELLTRLEERPSPGDRVVVGLLRRIVASVR